MKRFQVRLARRREQRAFTRAELAALLAVLTLLAAVALPGLAGTRPRAQRLTCVSHLREIGQSFISWSSEYDNRLPSQVPANDGGILTHSSGLQNAAWFHFAAISNHVRSPRIFVCPSDTAKREASSFDLLPNGGFVHPNYQNNALSYIVSHPLLEARPDVLSGDRHLASSFAGGGCLYWLPTRILQRLPGSTAFWTDALHASTGNVVLSDGRVEQLSAIGLRRRLADGASENSTDFHFLAP